MKSVMMILLVFGICFGQFRKPIFDYNRADWKHWTNDKEREGRDTRQEVLIRDNLASPDSTIIYAGKIVKGRWICPYTGDTITNPEKLDIDHLVPLKEAWWSGGDMWSPKFKELYANSMFYSFHLVAVKASANRSKGRKDPFEWMPDKNKCWYLESWLRVKAGWGLHMDADEEDFIFKYRDEHCECKN